MKNGAWTQEEIQQATAWRAVGRSFCWIDKRLGRKIGSTQGKLMNSSVKPKTDKKMRPCLGGCNSMFLSTWEGNRIYPRCSARAKTIEQRFAI